jgi:deoxycytidylate deaminase
MNSSQYKFHFALDILTKIASNSDIAYKHAAALIHHNQIYASAINKYIPLKKSKGSYYKTIHAELNVFERFPKRHVKGKGIDLIVIRINKQYALKNSRPCSHCIDELRRIGIRKVYYSNDSGDIVSELVEHMEKIHVSAGKKFVSELCI